VRVASFLLLTSALFWSLTPLGRAQAAEPPATAPSEHPEVHLDRLEFPKDLLGAAGFEKHLRKVLKREAYRADWGAGSANRIEYRLVVEELLYTVEGRTLRIHCRAVGRLPGGQTAKSELTYGGDLAERVKLTHQVLEIVGRGVITRLAELERRRRGLR
jgi:hypothetical protein